MITLGDRHMNCPVCGEDVIVGEEDSELIHKCINADRTRKTSNKQGYFPAYNLTKLNTDHWQNLAGQPYPTKLNESQIRKMKNKTREVTADMDL